jgi:hypothetical protein
MQIQFVGSGDAFANGGRFNTCFHISGEKVNFLIDYGDAPCMSLDLRTTVGINVCV